MTTITPAYIPADSQTDQQAQARAQQIGVGVGPRDVPPVYAAHVTDLPGVIAEWGGGPAVTYLHDDGTITAADVQQHVVAPLEAMENAQPDTPDDPVASLQAQVDTLTAALAQATTLAQVRKAAQQAQSA